MLSLWHPFFPVRKSENSLNKYNSFDNLFDDMFKVSGMDYKKQDDGSFVLTVDLPGVKEEDINVELSEDILTVSGKRETATSSSTIKKSLSLPEEYDTDSIKAELLNGVLTLTLKTKVQQPKEVKKIKINQK